MDAVPELETCRICATCYVDLEFVHLFEPQENLQRELNFIVNEVNNWQLKIESNDGLPQRICANCFTKFCTIDAFRQECVAAQNILRNAMETSQTQTQPAVINENVMAMAPESSFIFNGESGMQEVIISNSNIEQLATEVTTLPEDVAINYNLAYNADGSANLVVSQDSTNLFTVDQTQTAPVVDNANKSVSVENIQPNNMSEDLEDMLLGSIIPKTNAFNHETSPPQNGKVRKTEETSAEFEFIDNEETSRRLSTFAYACNYCYCPPVGSIDHLIFRDSEELSQHFFDIHDPNLPYPCPMCPNLFATMCRRNNHINKFHNKPLELLQKCPYCHKSLRTPLDVHKNNCTYVSDWRCDICNRFFPQMQLLSFRAHQRKHKVELRLRCEICNRAFSNRSNLQAHKRVHRDPVPMKRRALTCIECKQTFGSAAELKTHEIGEHKGKACHRCVHCDRIYTTAAFLKRHMDNFHFDKRPQNVDDMTCSNCKTTFPSKLKLHFHQQRPKDENGHCINIITTQKNRIKTLTCPHCARRFQSSEQLQLHLQIHDARLRPHACERCSVRCRSVNELREHVSVAHLNVNAFSCAKCGERFGYKKDLDDHKIFHEELKFKCTIDDCKMVYRSEVALSRHITAQHTPISCEFCGELFPPKDIAAHHTTAHSNVDSVFDDMNVASDILTTYNVGSDIGEGLIATDNSLSPISSIKSGGNVCVQYVNEPQPTILLNDNLQPTVQVQIEAREQQQEQTQLQTESIPQTGTNSFLLNGIEQLNGVIDPTTLTDVPLNSDDFFMSSLLDPDHEIVVI